MFAWSILGPLCVMVPEAIAGTAANFSCSGALSLHIQRSNRSAFFANSVPKNWPAHHTANAIIAHFQP